MNARLACAAVVSLGMLVSCGGGGGGGGGAPAYGPETVMGAYRLVGVSGYVDSLLGHRVNAVWGSATLDGVAAIALSAAQNTSGEVSPPTGSLPATYTVDPDGAFEVTSGASTLQGNVGAGGRTAVLVNVSHAPSMFVFGRAPTGPVVPSDFAGLYHLVAFTYDVSVDGFQSVVGTVTADGGGGLTFGPLTANREGVISPIPAGLTATSTVAGDGTTTITLAGATMEGTVLEGGDLVLLGGGTAAGQDPTVFALVRSGAGTLSTALLGTYGFASFEAGPGSTHFGFTGRLTATASTLTRTAMVNVDGVVSSDGPWSTTTFAVASDGALTVQDPAGDTLRGGITQDGRIAILGGPTTSGSRPTFQVLLRQ